MKPGGNENRPFPGPVQRPLVSTNGSSLWSRQSRLWIRKDLIKAKPELSPPPPLSLRFPQFQSKERFCPCIWKCTDGFPSSAGPLHERRSGGLHKQRRGASSFGAAQGGMCLVPPRRRALGGFTYSCHVYTLAKQGLRTLQGGTAGEWVGRLKAK